MKWIMAVMFVAGVCLAGADGEGVPFVNLAGLGLFYGVYRLARARRWNV